MGIDGIGSKGPPAPRPPAAGAQAPTRAPEAGRAFEVGKAAAPVAAAPSEVSRGALERLRAGEIDVDGYVDAKVHEATAHLGALPPARLEEIRAALRDRMTGDPALADLLRTAAGHASPPPGDD